MGPAYVFAVLAALAIGSLFPDLASACVIVAIDVVLYSVFFVFSHPTHMPRTFVRLSPEQHAGSGLVMVSLSQSAGPSCLS